MPIFGNTRRTLTVAVSFGALTLSSLGGWSLAVAQESNERPAERAETSQSGANEQEQSRTRLTQRQLSGETPALGVIVGPCPGEAVCVHDTVWGSPADSAGIRPGDYIVAMNGKKVSTPAALKEELKKQKKGSSVNLTIWRDGEESQQSVQLATAANGPPDSHRAWLGVLLTSTDEGLIVEQVVPESPAEKAGLQTGDVIVQVGDRSPKDVGSFIDCVSDKGPGAEMSLTIRRNGEEQTVDATLGDLEVAPMAFMRQALQPLMQDSTAQNSGNRNDPWMGLMETALDEMRKEIRDLQQEVQDLRSGSNTSANSSNGTTQKQSDLDIKSKSAPKLKPSERQAADVDTSAAANLAEEEGYVLGQRRGRRGRRMGDAGRDWTNIWNRRYDYGFNSRSNGWPDWRSELRRNSLYGNSYYNYGGRPYYYGNYGNYGSRYGYGLRSVAPLGRNLGFYWY